MAIRILANFTMTRILASFQKFGNPTFSIQINFMTTTSTSTNYAGCAFCQVLSLAWESKQEHDRETDHMVEIRPRLFIGMQVHATSDAELRVANIKHIVSMAKEHSRLETTNTNDFKFHWFPLVDIDTEFALAAFVKAAKVIHDVLVNTKDAVLVHCHLGKSRSVAAAMAYLIMYDNHTVDTALSAIKKAKPHARPNDGYIRQLRLLSK